VEVIDAIHPCLHTDDGVKYGVTVPDLPGLFLRGGDLRRGRRGAYEAIDAHVELLAEEGAEPPAIRPLGEHQANPDLAGAVWVVIDVPVERYFGPPRRSTLPRAGAIAGATSTRTPGLT